jgi:hypothetical protein
MRDAGIAVASVALGVAGVALICFAIVEAGWIAQRVWKRWRS